MPVDGREIEYRDFPFFAVLQEDNCSKHLICPEHERRASDQAWKDLFNSGIKTKRGKLQHSI